MDLCFSPISESEESSGPEDGPACFNRRNQINFGSASKNPATQKENRPNESTNQLSDILNSVHYRPRKNKSKTYEFEQINMDLNDEETLTNLLAGGNNSAVDRLHLQMVYTHFLEITRTSALLEQIMHGISTIWALMNLKITFPEPTVKIKICENNQIRTKLHEKRKDKNDKEMKHSKLVLKKSCKGNRRLITTVSERKYAIADKHKSRRGRKPKSSMFGRDLRVRKLSTPVPQKITRSTTKRVPEKIQPIRISTIKLQENKHSSWKLKLKYKDRPQRSHYITKQKQRAEIKPAPSIISEQSESEDSDVENSDYLPPNDASDDEDSSVEDSKDISEETNLYQCKECKEAFPNTKGLKQHIRDKQHSGSKFFQCRICEKSFTHCNNLSKHVRIFHTPEKSHKCSGCKRAFWTNIELERHARIHSGVDKYECAQCGKSFANNAKLILHERIHSGELSFKCPNCNKDFTCDSHLARHMRTHTGEKPYLCEQCGRSFSQKGQLRLHEKIHLGVKDFQCQECGKAYSDKRSYIHHMKMQHGDGDITTNHQCQHCGKLFTLRKSLVAHEKSHTGKYPFMCQQCGKTFPRKLHLEIHMRKHTGEKPYNCRHCGKAFSQVSNLRLHEKLHSEKQFQCEICGKPFHRKGNLAAHVRTHAGEKPFRCQQCGKSFVLSTDLSRHQRTHNGIKPYQCQWCGKSFSHRWNWVVHTKSHSGEHPYRCRQCGHSFPRKSALVDHEKNCKNNWTLPIPGAFVSKPFPVPGYLVNS